MQDFFHQQYDKNFLSATQSLVKHPKIFRSNSSLPNCSKELFCCLILIHADTDNSIWRVLIATSPRPHCKRKSMTCQLINRISLAMPVDTCLPRVLMCFQMFSPAASNKYELFPASWCHLRCTFAVCIHGDAQRLGCQAATHLWRRYSFFYRAALIYIASAYIKRHNKIAWICVNDPPIFPFTTSR